MSHGELALQYAKNGWHVFPVHSIAAGECSCGKSRCKDAGKHPRTRRGFKDATTEPEVITAWWTQWPDTNIGIATGPSDLLVLDVDVSDGKPGLESLDQLQADHGILPDTMTVRTGSGGLHLYFSRDGEELKGRNGLRPGLDVKARGGYVVAPGSGHLSGKLYEVEAHHGVLASVPEFFRAMTQLKRPRALRVPMDVSDTNELGPAHNGRKLSEGERNDRLASMGGGMRALGFDSKTIRDALLDHNARYCNPPLGRDEVIKVADSISRYTANVPYGGGVMLPRKPDMWLQERPVHERIFMYLLRRATFAPGNGLRLGQVRSSWSEIVEGTSWLENNRREQYKKSTVRAASTALEAEGYITRLCTPNGSLFTVVNYQQHQGFLLHAG